MVVHTPGAFVHTKPPRSGARVLVIEWLGSTVRVQSARVHPKPHHLSGGPCALVDGLWKLLLPRGEGVLWARGWGSKTRAALEAAFRLSGIV